MSEMVERVARAITDHMAGATLGANAWEHLENEAKAEVLVLARAALAAMREPTEAMTSAAQTTFLEMGGWADADDLDRLWQAMIDAALGDSARGTGGET